VACIPSLLEVALRNAFNEGPSNRPVTQATTSLEERMGEQAQNPQQNHVLVHSTIPAPTPTTVDAFANESHKTRFSNDVNQYKMAALKARVRVIERIRLI